MRVMGNEQTVGAPGPRFDLVDAARGVAIAAMILYHFSWDLGFLHLIALDVASDPVGQWAARGIAGSFLVLVGVGLVLGHARGIRWGSVLKRLAILALAALGITLVTAFMFPDGYIYFGILHAIAVSSVLALPFLRAPVGVVLGAAAVVLTLPLVYRSPVFNDRLLAWVGLAEDAPPTNDYEPLFPWFGMVLIGVAVARIVLRSPLRDRLAAWRVRGRLGRLLVFAGRWSLVIYLVHQPLLLGVLVPVAMLAGPNEAAETADFLRSCEASCARSGGEEPVCRRGCTCSADAFKREGLWRSLQGDTLHPPQEASVRSLSQQCFEEARPPRPDAPP